jgi:hypothetical protein
MAIKKPVLNTGKKVKAPELIQRTPDTDHPVFCFRYIAKGYDLSICTNDESTALVKRLAALSQMTWEQIRLAHRHGMGTEKIARTSINGSMPTWATADVDYFLALRFLGKAPFVGHRQGQIFHILWIDRAFTLYKH